MIMKQENASMFYRHAENLMVVLFQKKIERHGNVNHDPKFLHIAKKYNRKG